MTFRELILTDMKPAFGVTEPGAIAYAAAKAAALLPGVPEEIELLLNSSMFKNAFTCPVPGTDRMGPAYSAALGAVCGDPEKGLEGLSAATEEGKAEAARLTDGGMVKVNITEFTPVIYILCRVKKNGLWAEAEIKGSHSNIIRLTADGKTLFTAAEAAEAADPCEAIKEHSFREILGYVLSASEEELSFFDEAFKMDEELYLTGKSLGLTTITETLRASLDDSVKSKALLASCGPIEARTKGAPASAMSITGSGSHGILSMMPCYAAASAMGRSRLEMLRAVALAVLVTIYIKEYSGRLSAFCGCAIAGGVGTACGLVLLMGGGYDEMSAAMRNMASSITGMICHGGNEGCAMKALTGVTLAYDSAVLAMGGIGIGDAHGINGDTPEKTMQNIGRIASPGMLKTEESVVGIMEDKLR